MHPVEMVLWPLGRALRGKRSDETRSISLAPELAIQHRFAVSSPAFGDGEVIPAKHCGPMIGADVSPALRWGDLPEGTKDVVLILEDVDVPHKNPSIHTIAAFTPTENGLPEGALRAGNPAIRYLPNRLGQRKYVGPRPLPGHGTHHYSFHLYALDTPIDFTTTPTAVHLPAALKGHVLASGTLTGTRAC